MAASPFYRGERQANSSSASGLKRSGSPVKSDLKPGGISSPALDPKLMSEASQEAVVKADPESTIKVDAVKADPESTNKADNCLPTSPTRTDDVSIKAETEDLKADGRHESGEIGSVKHQPKSEQKTEEETLQTVGQTGVEQKGVQASLQTGLELTVKVKVEVKDEAVGSSPVARPQEQRLRDRYIWGTLNCIQLDVTMVLHSSWSSVCAPAQHSLWCSLSFSLCAAAGLSYDWEKPVAHLQTHSMACA